MDRCGATVLLGPFLLGDRPTPGSAQSILFSAFRGYSLKGSENYMRGVRGE